jgi:hypothetical protein
MQQAVNTLEAELSAVKADADKFTNREKGESRIEWLKQEEKALAEEYENLERAVFLCEQFVRTKARLLTDRINERFELVSFKLFEAQVNGGLSECCIPTVKGVPYDSGLNSAGRTQAGCDIVRTLQRHYDIHPVIWIDNREGCTEIPAMECQVISLHVSPADYKTLRVEKEKAASNGRLPGMAA